MLKFFDILKLLNPDSTQHKLLRECHFRSGVDAPK